MKSVAIKGQKQFEVKEIEEPVSKDGYVVLDVKKAGICGSDIHYWVSGQPEGFTNFSLWTLFCLYDRKSTIL